jgi:hypothetical protein
MPEALGALKIVPVLAMLALLPLCLWLPGPSADNRQRLAVAAVVMLNPWVIAWSGRILSDLPFAALSLGALLLFLRIESEPTPTRGIRLSHILLCAAAVSLRTIGWAAVLAMAVILVTQRRWLWAVLLPAGVVLVLVPSWVFWSSGDGPVSAGYVAQVFAHHDQPVWRFALDNLLRYVAELPVIMVPLFGAPVAALLKQWHLGVLYPAVMFSTGLALLLLAGLAVARHWRDRNMLLRFRLFTFYVVISGTALAHFDGYPSGVQTRLLIPLLPILAWLVLVGLRQLWGSDQRLVPRLVLGLLICSALAHNGWRVAHPLRTSLGADGHGYVDPGAGAAWLRANTAPGTVLLVQEPLVRHVHARRPVVGIGDGSDEAITAIISRYRPGYLWVGPEVHGRPRRLGPSGRALLALARQRPETFAPVHQDTQQSTHIFAISQP